MEGLFNIQIPEATSQLVGEGGSFFRPFLFGDGMKKVWKMPFTFGDSDGDNLKCTEYMLGKAVKLKIYYLCQNSKCESYEEDKYNDGITAGLLSCNERNRMARQRA
ncbi:hypothetical protein FACS1894181_04010 [Bacteroidia bacterium]|nr:hypothetical protein FACS1894181_04010 [Bacteroidia bacterium]